MITANLTAFGTTRVSKVNLIIEVDMAINIIINIKQPKLIPHFNETNISLSASQYYGRRSCLPVVLPCSLQ